MTERVLATAGRFELLATCYAKLPGCTGTATARRSGGPVCENCGAAISDALLRREHQ